MMKKMIMAVFAVVMTACVTENSTSFDDTCGPIPSMGSYTVAYRLVDGQRMAVMTESDFDALTTERHDLKSWALCASHEAP